jgi:excisionase family DNA binding protein
MQMLSEDLLKGAEAAAKFLGPVVTPRSVYHMVEQGQLPVIRMGRTLFFRKSDLEKAFSSETKAA